MAWYWIVAITLLIVWSISLILAHFDEDYTIYWACGLLYPVMYTLCYPIRAAVRYDNNRGYFEKQGISKMQYVLGKRPVRR